MLWALGPPVNAGGPNHWLPILLKPAKLRGIFRDGQKEPSTVNTRTIIIRLAVAAAAGVAAVLAACYPSPTMTVDEYDVVVTVVTKGASFDGYQTYAMPDTVIQRPDDGGITRDFDELILADIHRNMQQLGYELEHDPENNLPDVIVVAGAVTEDQWTAWINIPWGGWWGYYYGGVSHAPVGFTYLYTLGTVTIDMVSTEGLDIEEDLIPVVWTASIAGPLQKDVEDHANRITDGIDQAFAQSPYLKTD
jgi:hypothetical protein